MLRYGGANPNANSFGFNGWTDQSLAEWLADTGQDAHSFISDPMFADVSADDFHLAPNSPALGRGILIPGLVGSQNIGANFDLFPTAFTSPPTYIPEPSAVLLFGSAGIFLHYPTRCLVRPIRK
jgi:hypothetical protein